MKISLYTFIRNTFRMDYHAIHMVKHHLDFFDEIIVHEGLSNDGSFQALSCIDKKIKIVRSDWDTHSGMEFIKSFKNKARIACTGDWCIMLDADEFIPEWSFELIRQKLATTPESVLSMTLTNFYGNYRVFCKAPEQYRWPVVKMCIHRNRDDIEFVGGDSSSVNLRGEHFKLDKKNAIADIHHFGFVRHAARLRENWRNMRGKLYNAPKPMIRIPSFVFDFFPHRWDDPQILDSLEVYRGELIKAVKIDPFEFVRDKLVLLKRLEKDWRTLTADSLP